MKTNYIILWPVRMLILLGFIAFAIILQTSCKKKNLNIQQAYPFEVKVMPVPKSLRKGERVEMRFSIQSVGAYLGVAYYLRYFQYDGVGTLQYWNERIYRPNDSYLLPDTDFRLYYTSKSETAHSFDVWISDNFGNEKLISFNLANK